MGVISLGGGSVGIVDETFKGFWDANANSPDYAVVLTEVDDYLVVSTAGTQTLPGLGSVTFEVGNFLVKTLTSFSVIRETNPVFNLPDGTIPMVTSGVLEASSLSESTDNVMAEKTIRTEASTIEIGPGLEMSEIGSEILLGSNASGNRYVFPIYPVSTTTQFITNNRPFYGRLRTVETDFDIQGVNTTDTTITSYDFTTAFHFQNNSFRLDAVNELTNFRARVTSQTTNQVVKYFPSQQHWNNATGITVPAGVSEVFRENTVIGGITQNAFRYFNGITYTIDYAADQTVILRGNGTSPWIQGDIQRIDVKYLLDEDDLDDDDVVISNFGVNIASRVDLNTDLNIQHTITYDVLHSANIQSLELEVTGGDNKTLTVPTSDVRQTENVTFTSVDSATQGTLTLRITGVATNGDTFNSNSVVINIRNVAPHEYIYSGLSASNNPAVIDVSTLTSTEITSATRYTVNTGTTTAGQYFMILIPDNRDLTSITDTVLNNDVTTIFTKTNNVRQINSIDYNSYVLGPLNAGGNEEFVLGGV